MNTEPIRLADGTHDQILAACVPPVPAVQRDIAQLTAKRAGRRGAAPMPSGGLFDDTARNQLNLF